MARYIVHIRTPRSAAEAFDYLADLRNFAEWDPGVTGVTQVSGEGAGPDSVYDVAVKGFVGQMTLRYHTLTHDRPDRLVVRAESRLLVSDDTITVAPSAGGDGCVVTYEALLTLRGPLGPADPLLARGFTKVAGRAAAGLERVLEGERLEDA